MPKKRKTRKEKLLHDQKRQTVHESASSVIATPKTETQQKQETSPNGMTFSLPQTHATTPQAPQKVKHTATTVTVSQNEYGYLSNDLMRTALLTGAIVFAELFIKLFIVH